MSDLIIKDMEMPENCNECFCLDMFDDDIYGRQYFCGILGIDALAKEHSRHKNCPLVEIPTHHGDMIDRDHLLSLIKGWNEDVENDKQNENSFVVGKTLNGVIRIIRGAHAVIEAEEEK